MSHEEYRLLSDAVVAGVKMMRLAMLVLGSLIVIESVLVVWIMRDNHHAQMECIARMCGGVNQSQNVKVERPLTNEDLILEQLRLMKDQK